MKCNVYNTEQATVRITIGHYESSKQYFYLCDKAAKELWEKYKGQINQGLMYWKNDPITSLGKCTIQEGFTKECRMDDGQVKVIEFKTITT